MDWSPASVVLQHQYRRLHAIGGVLFDQHRGVDAGEHLHATQSFAHALTPLEQPNSPQS
jgi:hypothetical protein